MQKKRKIAICLVVCVGALLPTYTYGIGLSLNSSWGQSGSVSDFYYGEQQYFQTDDNMFSHGESFVQDMGSTSCVELGNLSSGQFYTAASAIEPGTTIDGYQRKAMARSFGRGWEPPTDPVPVGDGWDVYVLLFSFASAVAFLRWKKNDETSSDAIKNIEII